MRTLPQKFIDNSIAATGIRPDRAMELTQLLVELRVYLERATIVDLTPMVASAGFAPIYNAKLGSLLQETPASFMKALPFSEIAMFHWEMAPKVTAEKLQAGWLALRFEPQSVYGFEFGAQGGSQASVVYTGCGCHLTLDDEGRMASLSMAFNECLSLEGRGNDWMKLGTQMFLPILVASDLLHAGSLRLVEDTALIHEGYPELGGKKYTVEWVT